MKRAAKDRAEELPQAIEELSVTTRAAMLQAVRCPATRLIAGSYVAPGGGICPLLAAHRRGGRPHDGSTGVSAFADVWDRYTGASTAEPRPIEQAERQMLEGLLVASLAREQGRREAAERRERATGRPEERSLGCGRAAGPGSRPCSARRVTRPARRSWLGARAGPGSGSTVVTTITGLRWRKP